MGIFDASQSAQSERIKSVHYKYVLSRIIAINLTEDVPEDERSYYLI